jgi:hypothetical protein
VLTAEYQGFLAAADFLGATRNGSPRVVFA